MKYRNVTTECRFVAHRMQADIFSFSCILGLRIKEGLLGSKPRVNLSYLFVVLIYQLITLVKLVISTDLISLQYKRLI